MPAPVKLTPDEFAERRGQAHPVVGLVEQHYTECRDCGNEGPAKPGGRKDAKGRLNQCPRCNGTMVNTVRWLPPVPRKEQP